MTTLRGPRITLRPWREADLSAFAALNDDPAVMRHLSGRLSREESDALAQRLGGLGLPQIVSFTVPENRSSLAVMRRIGLSLRGEFDHPRFADGHRLRRHLLFAADAPGPGRSTAAPANAGSGQRAAPSRPG